MTAISASSPGLSAAYQAQTQALQASRQQQQPAPPPPPPVQQATQVNPTPGKGIGQNIDIRA